MVGVPMCTPFPPSTNLNGKRGIEEKQHNMWIIFKTKE
jgi:hypothetical protein